MGFKFLLALVAVAAYTQVSTSHGGHAQASAVRLSGPSYARGYVRAGTARRGSTYDRKTTGYAQRGTGYDPHDTGYAQSGTGYAQSGTGYDSRGTGSLLGRRQGYDRNSNIRRGGSYDARRLVGQAYGQVHDPIHPTDTYGRQTDCNCRRGEECVTRHGRRRCERVSGYAATGGRRPVRSRCGRRPIRADCKSNAGGYGTFRRASYIGGACTRRNYKTGLYCDALGIENNIFGTLEECRKTCELGY